jgi:alpha-L-rhamnosidase
MYRDVLGVYEIAPREKKIRLRFVDSGLEWCRGSIPVGEELIDVEWQYRNGTFDVKLTLPKGYTYEIISTAYNVVIR